ncbi:Calpain-type cysteine protease DEK1 [Capsicum baccatum]|uniref:Calpain-type cysteine protease DEK1 n=1 Tax=Capsicum baccatum TaxID=33114 RepID=A0A2G2V1X8_CAPBA|nr:Calpain-type cysteine protease DEK1 [Capsicum baccatum]
MLKIVVQLLKFLPCDQEVTGSSLGNSLWQKGKLRLRMIHPCGGALPRTPCIAVDGWDSDPADVDLYDIDDVDWDGQYSSGRKRRSDHDGVVLDVDSFTRRSKLIASIVFIAPVAHCNTVLFNQGRLGDCWFLSVVAMLTEVSRISEVIISPEYNQEGIYTVRFCIQGDWVPVVVDDWIPCESPGKPAFSTSRKGNEMWVSLLEKAYAKLHGSYEALEGGLVQDALADLTGGAGEEIDMRSDEAQIDLVSGRLWSQPLHFKQEGFLLGAGSPSGSDVHISSSGIVQGHAYSILQVEIQSFYLMTYPPAKKISVTRSFFAYLLLKYEKLMATSLFRFGIHGQIKLNGMVLGLIHHLRGLTG